MSNQDQNSNDKRKTFDLVKRTSAFSLCCIKAIKKIKINIINQNIISQLLRSVTSIGANYMEADCAESKKDFIHKIGLSKKEAKETAYWLHLLSEAEPDFKEEGRMLWKEAHELTLIFSAIINKT
jgi:four helix bundle protein